MLLYHESIWRNEDKKQLDKNPNSDNLLVAGE